MRQSLTGLERLFNEKAKKNLLQNFQRKINNKKKLFYVLFRRIFFKKTFFQQLKALN